MYKVLVIILILATTGTTLELLETKIGNSTAIELLSSQKDTILNVIKDKCENISGGTGAFENLKSQPLEFSTCLEPIVNYTQFNEELEEGRKTGSTGDVFYKYCQKYPQIYQCIEATKTYIDLCLDPTEQHTFNKTLDFLTTLQPYMCGNEGNRIAIFLANGGVECMQTSFQDLQRCFEEDEGASVTNLMKIVTSPKSSITDQNCRDIDKTRECFFKIMSKCEESSPANVVEAFFKFLNREFACNAPTGRKQYLSDFLMEDVSLVYMRIGIVFVALITSVFLIMIIKKTKVSLYTKKLNDGFK